MSVRVNLLPEETRQRDRAAQQRGIAGLVAIALLAVLGGVYLWANSQVNAAETELLAEQQRTAELRSDEAELVAFRELADRRDESHAVLIASLAGEVSVAGVLQDVAAVMPSDTQVDSMSVTFEPRTDPPGVSRGTFAISGRTLTSHAPGVERVLIALDKVVSFRDLYLNSSSLEEAADAADEDDQDADQGILDETDDRIAAFTLDGQVGLEAETGRYVGGLPEELR